MGLYGLLIPSHLKQTHTSTNMDTYHLAELLIQTDYIFSAHLDTGGKIFFLN